MKRWFPRNAAAVGVVVSLSILAALYVAIASAGGPSDPRPVEEDVPGESPPEVAPHPDDGIEPLDADESWAIMAEAVAEYDGVSVEEGLRRVLAQHAFSQLGHELGQEYPDTYAGGWIVRQPEFSLFTQFIGPAPADAISRAEALEIEVVFLDDATLTVEQLQAKADRLAEALIELGSEDFVTTFYEPEQRVEAWAVPPPDLSDSSDDQLVALLPAEFQTADVAIDFVATLPGEEDHTYGGARLNGPINCTTGFSVISTAGVTGVSTAGHCGVDTYYEYPVGGPNYSTTWQDQHRDEYGDVEWHTTPHVEYDDFYTSETGNRQDVFAFVGSNGFRVSDLYCSFGRTSGFRCDVVFRTSVSKMSQGAQLNRLVAMNGDHSQGGDSGGPWYNGGVAAGLHHGPKTINGVSRDLFSKVHLLDEALNGVRILIN